MVEAEETAKRIAVDESMAKEDPPQNKLHDRYINGNCSLISSDGYIFKLPEYHVQSASSAVLREAMVNDPDETDTFRIEFDDEDLENASIIEICLNYLTGGQEDSKNYDDIGTTHQCLKFARKWDCATIMQGILSDLALRIFYDRKLSRHIAFLIGAEFDSLRVCEAALRNARQRLWVKSEDSTSKWPGGIRDGRSCMIPTFWDSEDFLINPRYSWAVIMATQKWQGTGAVEYPTDAEWIHIAKRFRELVEGKM
ncbi:hypothetical protein TREMEDRAFT_62946 [Tremella mesenterica DSM 1558]|uniref:uncharacterized protein n=1 Tax=Tremella mesenterica (strain ATCC 24925 / CBS 8224 / DSM 1558 / NBRC 9311 / NRRL Y-6157 / RJB 2259-6 / UBC 559-6) TaxID=578456 RepID=UPI0003F491DF|nr:uncharacterized protein TREMEDRAFT_62946 [Tremella mesenterica DSM 1558]EIW69216.1 hypothetical protein TREMEDRAFT_62946 [Tremella mesenterica DSM 1558]